MNRWTLPLATVLLCLVAVQAFADEADPAAGVPGTGGGPVEFGYTIVYVTDVAATVAFYEEAFGLAPRFVHPSGEYAELETGATALAFVTREKAAESLPGGFRPVDPRRQPLGMEIALVTPDVAGAHARALAAGATEVSAPTEKPWGQTVSYVRDPEGTLVELASPMGPPEETSAGPRHILTILAVSDREASLSFYRAAFGWPARVEVPVYAELELPDGRGLGLYQREGYAHNTNQAPAAVPDGGISGTEIYLHCDDLAAAIDRIRAAGARELSPLALRDWGDEAAYFADPDGNVLVLARPLPASDSAPASDTDSAPASDSE